MPIVSDKAVQEIEEQIQTEASEQLMAVIEVYGSGVGPMSKGATWTVKIKRPDRREYEGFGVKSEHKAKSGWDALAKMAENWKRAGFMEQKESSDT